MNITANWKVKITSQLWRLVLDLLHENCDGSASLFVQNMDVSSKSSISEDILLLSVSHTDTFVVGVLSWLDSKQHFALLP